MVQPSIPDQPPLVTITLDTPIGYESRGYGDEYGHGPATVLDAIVQEAARQLVAASKAEIEKTVRRLFTEAVTEKIRETVEAAASEPIQRTDQYGHRQGDPMTLRQLVVNEVVEQTKPTRRDGYSNNARTTIADVIRDEAQKAVREDLTKAVAEARNRVVTSVTAQAATLIGEAVKQGLR